MKYTLRLKVNGKDHRLEICPHRTLLDVLRSDFELTGGKEGCGLGHCGACTVLLNGRAVNSCLLLAIQCEGQEVTTIEGLSTDGNMDGLQKAFIQYGAIQCGFCTPGMILSAKSLLNVNPHPTWDQIKEAITGNLCRCTGYLKIVEAIWAAAQEINC